MFINVYKLFTGTVQHANIHQNWRWAGYLILLRKPNWTGVPYYFPRDWQQLYSSPGNNQIQTLKSFEFLKLALQYHCQEKYCLQSYNHQSQHDKGKFLFVFVHESYIVNRLYKGLFCGLKRVTSLSQFILAAFFKIACIVCVHSCVYRLRMAVPLQEQTLGC